MSSSIAVQTVKRRRSPHCTVLYHGRRAAPSMHHIVDAVIFAHSTCAKVAQAMRLGQPFMEPRGVVLSLKPQPCRQRRRAARKARASSRQPKIAQCTRSRRFWTESDRRHWAVVRESRFQVSNLFLSVLNFEWFPTKFSSIRSKSCVFLFLCAGYLSCRDRPVDRPVSRAAGLNLALPPCHPCQ